MGASQITSLTIVYSTVYSDADQRKHQSSASLAFVWGIHRGPVKSLHKWPVTRKMFPFDDVTMHHRFRGWLVTYLAPHHHPKQYSFNNIPFFSTICRQNHVTSLLVEPKVYLQQKKEWDLCCHTRIPYISMIKTTYHMQPQCGTRYLACYHKCCSQQQNPIEYLSAILALVRRSHWPGEERVSIEKLWWLSIWWSSVNTLNLR